MSRRPVIAIGSPAGRQLLDALAAVAPTLGELACLLEARRDA